MHLGLKDIVVNTVQEYIHRCGCTRSKGSPLPEVIFCVQTKVNNNDRSHSNDNGQNGVNTEQKAVYVVEFVVPERGQNVIEFNKDGTKTQQTS
mmetsp:Transcript_3064/g.3458  ORF Transcript_3064/g.3458 Transcript_3064/m.3458 type:complete len:93 (-) Transcript_3064:1622-1900(-)